VSMPTLLVSSYGASRIDAFPADATGNIAPTYTITGALTTLASPRGIVVDNEEIFVADQGNAAIDVFKIDATGNVAPLRQIKGALTTLGPASQLYVTDTEIYVADQSAKVAVFPRDATGNVAPTRSIAPTGLTGSLGVAVYKDELYVSSYTQSIVYVVPANSTGTIAPTRMLSGPTSLLSGPQSIHVFNDELFVANEGNALTVYDPKFSTPVPYRRIAGATTNTSYVDELARLGDRVYSANYNNSSVQVFDIAASGDAAPLASLTGATTKINGTLGLTIMGVDE
ncbi:MAG TPA: hypothetical protein VGC41_16540, partial [Kofleriaceae bacterium]